MKTKALLILGILVFSGFFCYGNDEYPIAISPGVDGGIGIVDSRCPTFSWSGVNWAKKYQIVLFLTEEIGVKAYEEMTRADLVFNKEIAGGAFSWTPSLEQALASGLEYVWYVGAMDGEGNWVWSEGRKFRIEENINQTLIEDVRKGFKQQDVKDEVFDKVLSGVKSGLPVGKPKNDLGNNPVRPLGNEGDARNNVYYGNLAGFSLSINTIDNAFFGFAAGYSTDDGDQNTFLGTSAGESNTDGSYNTFVGFSAGSSNTTANSNTFIGYSAGNKNTTGYDNIFIGYSAGINNTTGYNNTFFGYCAGNNNTTGYDNIFLGYKTGFSNTVGHDNTFLGLLAGNSNTNGNDNTFLGYMSGRSNTTGYDNTFIGTNAGINNTTGDSNTFLGFDTGNGNTTGNYNTFIGNYAGQSNTTGYGNVFLGYKAGYYETGSNFLYIDNSTTSSPLIYGNFDTNFVKINGNFQVTGSHSGDFQIVGNLSLDSGSHWINSTELNILDGKTLATGSTNNNILVTKGYVDENDDVGVGLTGSDMTDTYLCKWDDANTRLVDSLISEIPGKVNVNGWLGVGTADPVYPIELKTNGRNAAIVANRTDGAVNFMNATTTYGQFGTVNNYPVRILVNSSGKMTLNANNSLMMASGATCTIGGVWQNASSRDLKENIVELGAEEAFETLKDLNPVRFVYKADKTDEQVGFIAEDVPDLVASKDRKGMSPMDVVAVLTKVVKEQQVIINELQERIARLERK